MKHKDRRRGEEKGKNVDASPRFPVISRLGWKIIGSGGLISVLGYAVLCFSDPTGRNWASHLCPFLILGGYAVIGFGILAHDRPARV